ncbi:MAG: hypothetical protein ACLQGP_20815 [Isosphaeraceae bacterium]
MNPESRLAEIVTALERVSVSCLVMGGHAVRYYGLRRDTIDFDLHLAPDGWDGLSAKLAGTPLFAGLPVHEGPSWRPRAFRRFQIGRLPDGREEWLEFWCGNHLLSPFSELHARREEGVYGGRTLSFLSLPDLIRSKETERAVDWQDIAVLEEFLDIRRLAQADLGKLVLSEVLGGIRSRRGLEAALRGRSLADVLVVERALKGASLAVAQAFLLPFAPTVMDLPATTPAIEPVILSRLRSVAPASPLHLALVEAVRRQYRLAAQAADKADKEAVSRSADR